MSTRTISVDKSVPTKVLNANQARRGFRIKNSDTSFPVLVRAQAQIPLATVAGVVTISLSAVPTAGSFKIRFTNRYTGAALTTASIAAGASNATVQTAVRLLTGYGSITVGNPTSGIGYKLTLTSSVVPDDVCSVVSSTLSIAGTAEVQTLTIVNGVGGDTPSSGTYTIGVTKLLSSGVAQTYTTEPIAYDATATTVQTLLRDMLGDQALTVENSFASAFTVTFGIKKPMQLITFTSHMRSAGDVEVQGIAFTDVPSAGTFKLKIGDQVTGELDSGETNATIQTAVRLLTGFGSTTVTGNFSDNFVFTFTGVSGNVPPIELVDSDLEVAEVDAIDCVQGLTVSDPEFTGNFHLTYLTMDKICTNATTAAQLQTSLRAVAGHEACTVTGDWTAGFVFTFVGISDPDELVQSGDTTNGSPAPTVTTPWVIGISQADVDGFSIETLKGGTKALAVAVARTVAGVEAIDVTSTVAVNTAGDLKALSTSVALGTTLEVLDVAQAKNPVYVLQTDVTAMSLDVTEIF